MMTNAFPQTTSQANPLAAEPPVLTIADLHTHFATDEGVVRAIDGVSMSVPRGRTLGIVGESGSGKSITAYSVLRLVSPPGRIVSGRITLRTDGQAVDLTRLRPDGRKMRQIRGNRIAMIFQEPMSSLSPVHTIGSQIGEVVRLHESASAAVARRRAVAMMGRVGIPDPQRRYDQYPHQLSGGLRQRAVIAMALCCRPEMLIADEPTTALDVTIQRQVLDLLVDLQAEMGMAIMLITHDLGVVARVAHEVAVMYQGRIVEQASREVILNDPQHPYTQGLLRSIPSLATPRGTRLASIRGTVPDPLQVVPGCPFHPRCPEAVSGKCDVMPHPKLVTVAPGHAHACRLRLENAHA